MALSVGYDEDGKKYHSALEVIPRAIKRDGPMAVRLVLKPKSFSLRALKLCQESFRLQDIRYVNHMIISLAFPLIFITRVCVRACMHVRACVCGWVWMGVFNRFIMCDDCVRAYVDG